MKRPERRYSMIIQHDNARSHFTDMTKYASKIAGSSSTSTYYPDLAHSDDHLSLVEQFVQQRYKA